MPDAPPWAPRGAEREDSRDCSSDAPANCDEHAPNSRLPATGTQAVVRLCALVHTGRLPWAGQLDGCGRPMSAPARCAGGWRAGHALAARRGMSLSPRRAACVASVIARRDPAIDGVPAVHPPSVAAGSTSRPRRSPPGRRGRAYARSTRITGGDPCLCASPRSRGERPGRVPGTLELIRPGTFAFRARSLGRRGGRTRLRGPCRTVASRTAGSRRRRCPSRRSRRRTSRARRAPGACCRRHPSA